MPTESIRVTFPGRMSRDARYTVTFVDDEFPEFPIAVHFALIEADNGARDYFNIGVEIGERAAMQPGREIERLPPRRISPSIVRHVAENYGAYERTARAHLEHDKAARTSPIVVGERPRERREMTPTFLTDVATEYEEHRAAGRSPLKELAKDYGVNVSTVSRWIKAARQRGYMK